MAFENNLFYPSSHLDGFLLQDESILDMDEVNLDLFPDLNLLENSSLNLNEDDFMITTSNNEENGELEIKEESDLTSNSSFDYQEHSPISTNDQEEKIQTNTPSPRDASNSSPTETKILTLKICNSKALLQNIIKVPHKVSKSNLYFTQNTTKSDKRNISKNAIAARENRLKKKKYIEDLEKSVSKLQNDNDQLKEQVKENELIIENMRKENAYLSNVLANASDLSALLKNIGNTAGIQFSPSLNGKRNGSSEDEHHARKKLCPDNEIKSEGNVGICLHVSNKKVSFEFCSSCNENANEVWKE